MRLLALLLLLLQGCIAYPPMTAAPHDGVVTVSVMLRDPVEVSGLCAHQGARSNYGSIAAACSGQGWIITPRPSGWDDTRALYLLGHEMLHQLGAKHE